MCPLWPLHIILLYVLCLAPLVLMAQHIQVAKPHQQPKQLKVVFGPEMKNITEGETKMIEFQLANMDDFDDRGSLEVEVVTSDPQIASAQFVGDSKDFSPNTNWTGSFNLTARFLGYTKVVVRLWGNISTNLTNDKELIAQSESGKVAVIRRERAIDKAFIYTIAVLISVAFINMGCMLDLEIVKATLKKPIGPAIGFCCQYIFMPLVLFF
jgi:sodium/bile acid cotransporter 3/5